RHYLYCHYIFLLLLLSHFYISFFLHQSDDLRDLHSFPTRRSSDLIVAEALDERRCELIQLRATHELQCLGALFRLMPERLNQIRSEEHTSELQSLAYLVCRLLLEKKNKKLLLNPHTIRQSSSIFHT